MLILEDLVAEGATPYALSDTCGIDHARGLIDAFAKLHSTFRDSPRFVSELEWVRPWSTRPGSQFLNRFYSHGRHAALELDRPEAGPAVTELVTALDGNSDAFYRSFESGPLTLLHGDSHLGNTFSRADGRSGLLDWQVIWRGPGMREVTYWMVTGLETEMRRAHERDLIDRYLEGLRALDTPDVPDHATAFDQYRTYAAEAWDATAMTIAWPGLQAPENIEAGWRRSCIAVDDLDVAAAVARLR
ncbi:phosphotransferase [Gordonia terrae]|uniref:phosphotransferase n=1 Tax=Gordonia terrae TaxID=2055 RepID=UPI00200A2D42|nr:phosphotransferase [Gordonia terrae]UPW08587.1 phosphotransferase [Gordonia terrae]